MCTLLFKNYDLLISTSVEYILIGWRIVSQWDFSENSNKHLCSLKIENVYRIWVRLTLVFGWELWSTSILEDRHSSYFVSLDAQILIQKISNLLVNNKKMCEKLTFWYNIFKLLSGAPIILFHKNCVLITTKLLY